MAWKKKPLIIGDTVKVDVYGGTVWGVVVAVSRYVSAANTHEWAAQIRVDSTEVTDPDSSVSTMDKGYEFVTNSNNVSVYVPEVREEVELPIKVFLTLNESKEPTQVTVTGFGGIPYTAVQKIAQEGIDSYFGTYDHGFVVSFSPTADTDSEDAVYEVGRPA